MLHSSKVFNKGVSVYIDHVVIVGRNANNGTNAGTFNVNANNDSSNRNRNIGTQLAEEKTRTTPARGGEYVNPISLGSVSEQRGCHQQ
jgi:hypothetical protein